MNTLLRWDPLSRTQWNQFKDRDELESPQANAKYISILSQGLVALRLHLEPVPAFCGGAPKTAPRCRYSLAD